MIPLLGMLLWSKFDYYNELFKDTQEFLGLNKVKYLYYNKNK